MVDACRTLSSTEHTYDRWKKEYGGLRVDQAKRLKGLEQENVRLKRLVADLSLDNSILQEVLGELFLTRGCPMHIRSDNGPEFIARSLRQWVARVKIAPFFIEPGSPWEHGYRESFNGKFRDDLLAWELFYTLLEAQVLIERWRRHDNTKRPHSSLGDRPPAPDTMHTPTGVCMTNFKGGLIAGGQIMITRLFVITILWGLGIANFVHAEWQETGTAEHFSHYVDPGSISKTDHLAKMWVLDDYKVPQKTLDGKPFFSVRTREEYDCKKEKVRTHSVIAHADHRGKGIYVWGNNYPDDPWRPISRGSADETDWKIACGEQ